MTQYDPSDQSQPTDLDRIKTLMTIWNTMSEPERLRLKRAANTESAAETMRHAGYDVPPKPTPSGDNP